MNRYQKPEVYNRLAMEYSLGTLRGHARKRFERLMQQQPYLQAIVEAHDLQFAELSAFLPDKKPSDAVWKGIESALAQSESAQLNSDSGNDVSVRSAGGWSRFKDILSGRKFQGLASAFVILLLASVVFLKLSPLSEVNARAFAATLVSAKSHEPMAEVHVKKDDMKLVVKLKQSVEVPKGMKMVFWCVANDPDQPYMNMGELAAQGVTEKQLEPKSWKGIAEASQFAVSIEPEEFVNSPAPSRKLIFVGDLVALK